MIIILVAITLIEAIFLGYIYLLYKFELIRNKIITDAVKDYRKSCEDYIADLENYIAENDMEPMKLHDRFNDLPSLN